LTQGVVRIYGRTSQPFRAHKPKRVRELIECRGCELLYLPTYSPDDNLTSEAFSEIKRFLRRVGARIQDALVEAIG
jgi:transposase